MGCRNSGLTGNQNHRLNSRFITRNMQSLGNSVTVVEVIRSFENAAYREETETYINHTNVYCFVNILTEMDTSVQEGEARAGDLEFNFDISMEPYIKWMNRIIYDGQTFQISDVRKFKAINKTIIVGCLTKKFSDGTAWHPTLSDNIVLTGPFKKLNASAKLVDTANKSINKLISENFKIGNVRPNFSVAKGLTDNSKITAVPTSQITH